MRLTASTRQPCMYALTKQIASRYSAAAHPPPLLWRRSTQTLHELNETGLLLDRLQPALAPSNSQFVFRLLAPIEKASFPEERFAGAAVGPAAETWACGFRAASRRTPPPLRTPRRLSYRHRSLFNRG